jgi:hypothetical protein
VNDNPLVAPKQDSTTVYTGLSPVEAAVDLRDAITNGSWIDKGLASAGGGLEFLSFILDPLGSLAAYSVGWLIEQVEPLRRALDWFAGSPDQIRAYSQTWQNVAKAVTDASGDFDQEVRQGTSTWEGRSGDQYRTAVMGQIGGIRAAGVCADTIGSVVSVVGDLVGLVRDSVREIVAQCAATIAVRLPLWLLAEGVTLGAATPVVISSVASVVAKYWAEVLKKVQLLVRSLASLRPLMDKLGEVWTTVEEVLSRPVKAQPPAPTPGAGGGLATTPTPTVPGADGTTSAQGASGGGTTSAQGASGGGTPGAPPSGDPPGGGGGQPPGDGPAAPGRPPRKTMQALRADAAALRQRYNTNKAKEKTISVAEFSPTDEGVRHDLRSMSGRDENLKKSGLDIPGASRQPADPHFGPPPGGPRPQLSDAEAKILEDLDRRLGDQPVPGTLRIWVDHPRGEGPCPSCTVVIEQFHAKRPEVRIEIESAREKITLGNKP